jgi:glutamate/tyrosine decarboxylase-like PLP-dependent enzyme
MRIAAVYFSKEQSETSYRSFEDTISNINTTLSGLQSSAAGNSAMKQLVDSFTASFNKYRELSSVYYQALQQQEAQLTELGVYALKLNGSIEKSNTYYGGAALIYFRHMQKRFLTAAEKPAKGHYR